MAKASLSKSRRIRSRLDHPIIDADGHIIPFPAPLEDYVKAQGGSSWGIRIAQQFKWRGPEAVATSRMYKRPRPPWWLNPTRNTYDRATAALPKLLYERMDDLGIDFSILFSSGTGVEMVKAGAAQSASPFDFEAQRIWSRALSAYLADITREYADRMTTVAYVHMGTPEAAVEDLDYCVKKLGLKLVQVSSLLRPIPAVMKQYPQIFSAHNSNYDPLGRASTTACWLDTFGADSDYNYDPFWAKCVALKVPVTSHGSGTGFTDRSTSNFVYNHVGHFASAGEALCKSIFLSGVTRRFPSLRFAFLEGGASTGTRLYCDLVSHWKKRNSKTIQDLNPANLDKNLFLKLHKQYGDGTVQARLDQVLTASRGTEAEPIPDPMALDDFAACKIKRLDDLKDLFIPKFFFGCEADDPTNAVAFNDKLLPMGARVNTVLGSDIGHWDVSDISEVVKEAYEMVEDGHITKNDFRDFMFTNPVKLYSGVNPAFFNGTVVEDKVKRLLKVGTAKR